mgnify:CR=1 FL=1
MPRDFALPGSRAHYAPDRAVDIEHYKIALDLDVERRRLAGTCSVTLSPIAPDVRSITLDAVELDISAVRSDGAALRFHHDGRKLRIELGRLLPPGHRTVIEIDYAGSPRRGLYFVGPDEAYPMKPRQVWSQGQDEDSRYWFPCFDSPHEKATSELVVTVPRAFFALSNGEMIEDTTDGERRTFHWKLDVPHSCYLITLAAGELSEIRDRWEDIAVTYHVAPGHEDACRRTLGRTPQMLELFSRLFGVRYPYRTYAQVFVADFIFGGMENTTATTLTDTVLLDQRAALDYDVESLVAHELAHQWFGDLLTCRDWGEGWLNEGFATYAEYLWREHIEGADAGAIELDAWAETYFGEDGGRYRRPIATKVYDEPIDIFDHHLYEKGGRVLHMLRTILGDDAFFASLARYVEKHRHGAVETRDLARAIEDATGRVMDWFFSQWVIDGSGHPELDVSCRWETDDNLAVISVKQTQKVEGRTPLFRLPVTLRFRVGGKDVDHDVEILEQQQTFHIALPAEPEQMIFDAGKVVLAAVHTDKPLPLWIAELGGATAGIDRISAARALAKIAGPKAVAALVQALGHDPFWAARGAAAQALGAIRSQRARDALVAALPAEDHPRVRRAIVLALGELRDDLVAAAAVARVVEHGDPSYFVEAEACLALGKLRAKDAPALLRRAAERDSFTDIVRQYAYRGLAAARDDSAVPFLIEASRYGRMSQGRRGALTALGQLSRGRRDRDAREVREHIEHLLGDPDFRVQMAALEALAVIDDPAATPRLQQVIDSALDGRLRRRGREIVRDLASGDSRDDAMRALKDEVDELRGAAIKLRERVDKLEGKSDATPGATSDKQAKKAQKKNKDKKKRKA